MSYLTRFFTALSFMIMSVLFSQAHALDVSAALAGHDASSNIDTAAVWILGIAVALLHK